MLDLETGYVSSAPVNPCNLESSGPGIIWKSKYPIWDIDWFLLKKELLNWEAPWRVLEWKVFSKRFLFAMVALIFSYIDIGFDCFLAFTFIHGADYIYLFSNESDPTIFQKNCTFNHFYNGSGPLAQSVPYRLVCPQFFDFLNNNQV